MNSVTHTEQAGPPSTSSTLMPPDMTTVTPTPFDLAARLATVPGLVRPGISHWDLTTRLPLHPLSVENAYGDPALLHALAVEGAQVADRLGAEIVVGGETGGIPLATAISLAAGLPFAFVRKPGYIGHEDHEPRVRGAAVARRRVLLVDDAVSTGSAVAAFAAELRSEGTTVVGVFTVVDMRDVSAPINPSADALPIHAVTDYLRLLDVATDRGVLDPTTHHLAVDALLNHWTDDDPRWQDLDAVGQASGQTS
jgi:orotate phosphoribosyltransferase